MLLWMQRWRSMWSTRRCRTPLRSLLPRATLWTSVRRAVVVERPVLKPCCVSAKRRWGLMRWRMSFVNTLEAGQRSEMKWYEVLWFLGLPGFESWGIVAWKGWMLKRDVVNAAQVLNTHWSKVFGMMDGWSVCTWGSGVLPVLVREWMVLHRGPFYASYGFFWGVSLYWVCKRAFRAFWIVSQF